VTMCSADGGGYRGRTGAEVGEAQPRQLWMRRNMDSVDETLE
jgi:hypothetical protein